jgi:signal transduction histidine kinase
MMSVGDSLAVLLVEDNPGDADLFERYLKQATFTGSTTTVSMTHAVSLAEAEEYVAAATFDAVFLDLGLPESSGLETLSRFLELDPQSPVIVLTGLADDERAVEAIQLGAQDYLIKDGLDDHAVARSLRYAIERYEHTEELQRQTAQMEFFNKILRHDMLNGMNVIRMRAKLLEENLDDEFVDYAETIVDWSDDIIDLTRKVQRILNALTGEGDVELGPEDLSTVVADQADRVRGMDDDATVEVDLPDDLRVVADDLLEEVVGNVMTNAVDHSETGSPHVEVTAEVDFDAVHLRIADDGPGIDDERKQAVFERGESTSEARSSGFGLYFVASMLDLYGGDAAVYDADDGGAVFELTFLRA